MFRHGLAMALGGAVWLSSTALAVPPDKAAPGHDPLDARVRVAMLIDQRRNTHGVIHQTDPYRLQYQDTHTPADWSPWAQAARLGPPMLEQTYWEIKRNYDEEHGGFGLPPKLPRPVVFNFLLRYYARTGDPAALEMTLHTLRAMAQGGIRDHTGGGFYRYSMDAAWHVPRLEKTLYDQAQLAMSYADAYQITKEPLFAEVTREILGYVLRDMRDPQGGFYSAEQAASADAAIEQLAATHTRRLRSAVDEQVVVAWNGLMISAFARAAQVLDEPRYLAAAQAAAAFIESRLYDDSTHLLKRAYRAGRVDIDAVLEDYAFLVQGLIDLYETSFQVKWLAWAVRLQAQQDALFWNAAGGGYFATRAEAAYVLVRLKDDYDGAEPSPNSVAAMNLLRLWQMTGRQDLRNKADATLLTLADPLGPTGEAVPQLVAALDFSLSNPRQIVIAGEPGAADTQALLRLVHDRFIPNKVLLLADSGAALQQLAQWLPLMEDVRRMGGRATMYICAHDVCRVSTADLGVAAQLLDGIRDRTHRISR